MRAIELVTSRLKGYRSVAPDERDDCEVSSSYGRQFSTLTFVADHCPWLIGASVGFAIGMLVVIVFVWSHRNTMLYGVNPGDSFNSSSRH